VHKGHASNASRYDANERNPMFAGAEKSNLWELSTMADHFHPSVALFGKTLLDGDPVGGFSFAVGRATEGVCGKSRPKCSPTHFYQK
jgi:hypothetical protein